MPTNPRARGGVAAARGKKQPEASAVAVTSPVYANTAEARLMVLFFVVVTWSTVVRYAFSAHTQEPSSY